MQTSHRRAPMQYPVQPVRAAVIGVLTEDHPQVPFAGDQHPVQALAVSAAHPGFGDRVRPGTPGVLMLRTPIVVSTASKAR